MARSHWYFVAAASAFLAVPGWMAAQAPAPGTAFKVELQTKLDSKKAKVGEIVKAKVNEDIKDHNTVLIQKNSTLLGKVTAVQASHDSSVPAIIGVLFEQVVPKNKKVAPFGLRAAVVKVYTDTSNGSEAAYAGLPPEMGGGTPMMSVAATDPQYAGLDQSSNSIPIRYSVMETSPNVGTDLGGEISSVGGNFNIDDGTHVEVRVLQPAGKGK